MPAFVAGHLREVGDVDADLVPLILDSGQVDIESSSCTGQSGPGQRDSLIVGMAEVWERAVNVRFVIVSWSVLAMSSALVAEHLVPAGEIDPDHIHTPGIFVQRIVAVDPALKRIEQRTLRKRA